MVKMLTVLVSIISNSQVHVFFDEKMCVAFANAKATHIFSEFFFFNVYAISDDQSFNDTLTNDIVSFEQLGQECHNHKAQLPRGAKRRREDEQ